MATSNNNKKRVAKKKPQSAYVMASWATLFIGAGGFMIGLYNADTLALSEKGFYLIGLMYGLYAAISLQKSIRDREEGIPVTDLYMGITWFALISSIVIMGIGLFNAELLLSEKGFYVMAFVLSLFSVVTVQKNTRDLGTGNGRRKGDYAEDLVDTVTSL